MPAHFHRVALRDPEPFSQMLQQCASCPSIQGVVAILQITHIIHNMQHSVPSTAPTSVSGSIQHRMQIPWRSTTECCRSDGGGWQTISWGCSSCDTSARILATFCWVHKPSSSRILSMLPSPAAQSRIDAWQSNWD